MIGFPMRLARRVRRLAIDGIVRCYASFALHGRLRIGKGTRFYALPRFIVDQTSRVEIGDGCVFEERTVFSATHHSRIVLGERSKIGKITVSVDDSSSLVAEEHVLLYGLMRDASIIITRHGSCAMKRCAMMTCDAYVDGGIFTVGSYTYLNPGTEIHCIKEISIADFCMISYDVLIYDNNSHATDYRVRRKEFLDGEQYYGTIQNYRPAASPVHIGNDVWVGRNSYVLKGTNIGDRAIIGMGTTASGNIPSDMTVVGPGARTIKPAGDGAGLKKP